MNDNKSNNQESGAKQTRINETIVDQLSMNEQSIDNAPAAINEQGKDDASAITPENIGYASGDEEYKDAPASAPLLDETGPVDQAPSVDDTLARPGATAGAATPLMSVKLIMQGSLSEQQRRQNLASELADILFRQQAIVRYNPVIQSILADTDEHELVGRLIEEDEKNLRIIETVATNFGIRSAPKTFTRRLTEVTTDTIMANDTSDIEKLGAYQLMKQQQVICGHLVHKSAQLAKLDVREALGMFLGVQTTMEKQVVQLTTMMEKLGTAMLSGEEADQGLMGRARDALAMAAGAVLSRVGKPADEMSIFHVLRLDHRKAMTLIHEVQESSDPAQAADLFEQLRLDLIAHSQAEEEVVYKRFRQFDDLRERLANSQDEHESIREQLAALTKVEAGSNEHKNHLQKLEDVVKHHVDEEEDELFKLFDSKVDETELQHLAANFMEAKQRLQVSMQEIGASDLSA